MDSQRKNVVFAETSEGVIMTESFNTHYSLDASLWLSQAEWAQIRQSAQSVVDSVQKGDHIWSEARRRSYIKTMTKMWRLCAKGKNVSDSMMEELIFWTSIGHSRRGLERFSLSEVQNERQRRRRDHIEGVMFVQDQCWDNAMDFEQTAGLLRVASEKLSKAANRFARILAAADSEAVANAVEDKLAQDVASKLSAQFEERPRNPSPPSQPSDTKLVANAAA